MPLPTVVNDYRDIKVVVYDIIKKNIIDKEDYYIRKNKQKKNIEVFNDRRIFYDEIKLKLSQLDYDNQVKSNLQNTILEIPIGKQAHLWIVTFVTTLSVILGFVMILYQIIVYKLRIKTKYD